MALKLTAAGLVTLAILAAAGLAIYGARVTPAQHTYEQVLPNDRFPN